MKRLLVSLIAGLAVGLACSFAAEPTKEKSPGDIAAEAFFKLRDDKEAKLDATRIQKLQQTGLDFLAAYPTHSRAGNVVTALANFGGTIKDKKLQPMRDYWGSQLNYEVLTRRSKSDATDEVKAVFGSLDATYAGFVARTAASRDTIETFRSKIDRVADLEGGARYLPALERDYIHALLMTGTKLAEAHATKLLASSDKKIAAVAREELNLIELGKQPLAIQAATLDGQGFDTAAMQGKVLYFVFWSSTHEGSVKELAALQDFYKQYQKLGVEIVTVSHDTDRAALEKFVKARRYAWPVIFDGEGSKGELSMKLNVKNVPASALFSKQGTLIRTGVKSNQFDVEMLKLGIIRK